VHEARRDDFTLVAAAAAAAAVGRGQAMLMLRRAGGEARCAEGGEEGDVETRVEAAMCVRARAVAR
jgi:hypothetical protein